MKDFNLTCKKCNSKDIEIVIDHDKGCSNPNCCPDGRFYYGIMMKCKCGNKEMAICFEDKE